MAIISPNVRKKLAQKDPPVIDHEINECFDNRTKRALIDSRQQHRTKPPTRWFIAETDSMRRLKIVFITYPSGDHIIKSAFEPDEYEEKIYENETKI